MRKHESFDVMVHSTEELEAILGEPVADRRLLHGWPFSAVERLTTTNGTRWIYKSQRILTVEPEFYARVHSPLLPEHRTLTDDGIYSTMLFEYIESPLLGDLRLSEAEKVKHGRRLIEAIGSISEEAPVYIDIGSTARWRDFVESTLGLLTQLIAEESLTLSVTDHDINLTARWAKSSPVHALINQTSRLTHGDLKPTNVFLEASRYRVIDWQRPQIAPAEVDLVGLMEREPYLFQHVSPATIGVFYFLRLYWAVNAKANLLPDLKGVFDWWSSEAITYIRRSMELQS